MTTAPATHHLFALEELAPGTARKVEIEGREIAIVRIDDDVYAIGDTCSHEEVSLSEGFVEGGDRAIECWRHGAQFDVATGEPLSLPATRPVPVYEIAVVDAQVVLTIGPDDDVDDGFELKLGDHDDE